MNSAEGFAASGFNAQSVLHSMQTFNNTSTAGSLDTFDFSTLYTSIPHVSLKTR